MRPLLPEYGYTLRLFDVRPVEGAPDAVTADLAGPVAPREAVRGVDAVLHRAASP